MNIEFYPVPASGHKFNKVRSSGDTIRFRVVRRASGTTFDADFFSMPVELCHSAWRQVASAWQSDALKHPCKKGDCGGGRACLVLTVAAEREGFWRGFLEDLLRDSNAWILLRAA